MKKMIKASSDYKSFEVRIEFAGMVGSEETYEILAKDEQEAEELVYDIARDDLTVEDVNQIDEDEWELEVGFNDRIGVSRYYTVTADDEQEAYDEAIDAALFDLDIVDIKEI